MYQDSCPLFLSSLSLCCLSLLLLAPFLPITDGPSPHRGKKVAKQPPTGRQTLSFQASWKDPQHWICWITCLSLGPIIRCCQGDGHCHWPHTCPLLVVGQDLPPEEKRWEGSVDLPMLELHARENAPRVKGYKMTPNGSKVFIILYKFPFLLI